MKKEKPTFKNTVGFAALKLLEFVIAVILFAMWLYGRIIHAPLWWKSQDNWKHWYKSYQGFSENRKQFYDGINVAMFLLPIFATFFLFGWFWSLMTLIVQIIAFICVLIYTAYKLTKHRNEIESDEK